jgi:hypothetical protein
MRKSIQKLFGMILPASGKRRAASKPDTSPRPCTPQAARSTAEYAPTEDPAAVLVRPYFLAHERRVEHDRRLRRRAGLVMVPHGIDLPEVVA